jgi:hypothetical protein
MPGSIDKSMTTSSNTQGKKKAKGNSNKRSQRTEEVGKGQIPETDDGEKRKETNVTELASNENCNPPRRVAPARISIGGETHPDVDVANNVAGTKGTIPSRDESSPPKKKIQTDASSTSVGGTIAQVRHVGSVYNSLSVSFSTERPCWLVFRRIRSQGGLYPSLFCHTVLQYKL